MKNTTPHSTISCREKRSHLRLSLASVFLLFASLFLSSAQSQNSIYAHNDDGFLEARDSLPPAAHWPVVHDDTNGSWTANMGEWFDSGVTVAVLPFQLPDYGLVSAPFTSATFEINIYQMGAGTVTSIDLYGLDRRSASTILVSDWYTGTATDTTSGTYLLQDSWLTPSTILGRVSTNTGGNTALVNFLNTQYDSGAGVGEYVFLRGSYASDTMPMGWDAYNFTTREASGLPEVDYPVIQVVVPEPGALPIAITSLGALGLLRRTSRSMPKESESEA